MGLRRQMSKILVTDLSRAIARSGLLPSTAQFFIAYLKAHTSELKKLLPRAGISKDGIPLELAQNFDPNDGAFVLIHLCFTSPEFGGGGLPARRNIPFQLGDRRDSVRAPKVDSFLTVRPWDRDVLAVNATDLTIEWMSGVSLIDLEARFGRLRSGVLRDMYRTLVGHLTGFADILVGMVIASDAGKLGGDYAWVVKERGLLFRVIRRVRQIARSVVHGVPEEVLWLAELADANNRGLCRRPEIVAFHNRNLRALEEVVDPGRKTDLIDALKEARTNPERWKIIRAGAIQYRAERTERRKASQTRRLDKDCEKTVTDYYAKRGVPFEAVLDGCLRALSIKIIDRDDESKRGMSFPDFVLEVAGRKIVLECKSSDGASDVSLGEASEVFKKAGIHNFKLEPLVTVCQPYAATDVPRKIEASDRLTIVNAEDLAEALVRLHLRRLDPLRFVNWLTTPGQARYEELAT
jgi:hypothetical protein